MDIKYMVATSMMAVILAACSPAKQEQPGYEAPSYDEEDPAALGDLSWTKGAMVAAADERAVDAALAVLADGGHAVDAAIAASTACSGAAASHCNRSNCRRFSENNTDACAHISVLCMTDQNARHICN